MTTTYQYDASGQRIKKSTPTQTTLYPSNTYEQTGTTTLKHVYANGNLVATVKSDTPTAKIFYNHQDHLSSTAVVTDKDGYLNQVLSYQPYGATRVSTQYGILTQPNQFIGQDFDPESNLSYLNARYYNSNQGQFVSQDPVFWEVGESENGVASLFNPQSQNSYIQLRS